MRNYQIYLTGDETLKKFNEEYERKNRWMSTFKNRLESFECANVKVINPNMYFSIYKNSYREFMELRLNKVRKSDLIIVNFFDVYSLETMTDMAIAYERKIPIIGLNEANKELHFNQVAMCNRIFTETYELLDYVEYFYLTE